MNEQVKAIRAEIERRIKEYDAIIESQPDSNRSERDAWKWAEDKSLLSFLDSLPEETDNGVDITDFCKPINPGIAQCIADHWWEMLDNEEPNCPKLSDNLEEAAEEFARFYDNGTCDGIAQECFIAGAKWQKEQMMKEAVEGTVHNFSSNKPHPTVLVDAKGFNQGDKVRVIIIKEK